MKEKALVLAFCLLFAACNDDDSSVPANGEFVDSPVSGLVFSSSVSEGITSASGAFDYTEGDTLEFSLGGIVLGGGTGARTLTPMDLSVATEKSVNIARFLQTIDNDGNPNNGIEITEIMRSLAEGRSIDFNQALDDFTADGNVQTVVADLTATRPVGPGMLIESAQARKHLANTLVGVIADRDAELGDLVGDATCNSVNDCDAIAIGNLACGGPADFLPFSQAAIDMNALDRVAASHRRHSQSLNRTTGEPSICIVVAAPPLACENNRCVSTGLWPY